MSELLQLIDHEIPEGRQHLQENFTNLEQVAQYCQENYLNVSDLLSGWGNVLFYILNIEN